MRFDPACLLAVALIVLSCASGLPPVPKGATALRSDTFVEPIIPGIWRHVSYKRLPGTGYFPSNGLVVVSPQGVPIIDTAWDTDQTAHVLDWVDANLGTISRGLTCASSCRAELRSSARRLRGTIEHHHSRRQE
jgi:hypothetical protein